MRCAASPAAKVCMWCTTPSARTHSTPAWTASHRAATWRSTGSPAGACPPLDPQTLNAKGSVFLTRPSLERYTRTREELEWRANDVFGWIAEGALQVRINGTFPLSEAAEAHRLIGGRLSTGKLLLIP